MCEMQSGAAAECHSKTIAINVVIATLLPLSQLFWCTHAVAVPFLICMHVSHLQVKGERFEGDEADIVISSKKVFLPYLCHFQQSTINAIIQAFRLSS